MIGRREAPPPEKMGLCQVQRAQENRRKCGAQLSRPKNLFLCGSFSGGLQNSILIPTKQESGPESSREAAAGMALAGNPGTPGGTSHEPRMLLLMHFAIREQGPAGVPLWRTCELCTAMVTKLHFRYSGTGPSWRPPMANLRIVHSNGVQVVFRYSGTGMAGRLI